MNILYTYGFNNDRIIALNCKTTARVNAVKNCWWFKVNTKPARTSTLDGAVFPHIIHFTYTVNGKEYSGSRFIHFNYRCPIINEQITVYYNPEHPEKYAVNPL